MPKQVIENKGTWNGPCFATYIRVFGRLGDDCHDAHRGRLGIVFAYDHQLVFGEPAPEELKESGVSSFGVFSFRLRA
jgi:hypothetical protein